MKNIGNVKPDGRGNFVGSIRTVGISMQIGLRPLTFDTIKAGKSYPKFGIMARASSDKDYADVGGLWEQSSNQTGASFYQGQIDDPSLASPLAILLFPQADGSMNVAWARPRDRSAFGNNGAPQTAGDGLGESTSGVHANSNDGVFGSNANSEQLAA